MFPIANLFTVIQASQCIVKPYFNTACLTHCPSTDNKDDFDLQIFQLHRWKGSNFELRDGIGCKVQCLQGNIWL